MMVAASLVYELAFCSLLSPRFICSSLCLLIKLKYLWTCFEFAMAASCQGVPRLFGSNHWVQFYGRLSITMWQPFWPNFSTSRIAFWRVIFCLCSIFYSSLWSIVEKICSLGWKLGERRILDIREVAYSLTGETLDTLFISRRRQRKIRPSVKK